MGVRSLSRVYPEWGLRSSCLEGSPSFGPRIVGAPGLLGVVLAARSGAEGCDDGFFWVTPTQPGRVVRQSDLQGSYCRTLGCYYTHICFADPDALAAVLDESRRSIYD